MIARSVAASLALVLIGCGPTLPVAPKVVIAKGPHGGQAQQVGGYTVELANQLAGTTATLDLYVFDLTTSQPVKADPATAQLIAEDGHAQTIKLAITVDRLEGKAELEDEGEYSVVVQAQVAGKPVKAVFSVTRP